MRKCFVRYGVSIVLILLFIVVPFLIFAQVGDPGDDPDVPIDGGLSILIAAGVGYGVKKIRDERKKRTTHLQ